MDPIFLSWGSIGSEARARSAARMGITMHRVPIWWGECEKEEGKFDFNGVAEVARWVLDANMALMMNFSPHFVPGWFLDRHPDARLRDVSGRSMDPEAGPSYWFPQTRHHVKRFIDEAISYLIEEDIWNKIDGVEVCVQFEGQLSYPLSRPHETWAFDKYALQAYSDFLRTRYEDDIGKLNDDWGSGHTTFYDIKPPRSYSEDKEHEVFLDFYRQNLLDAVVEMTDVVKRRLPEGNIYDIGSHRKLAARGHHPRG